MTTLHKYWKTAAMAAASYVGEAPNFLLPVVPPPPKNPTTIKRKVPCCRRRDEPTCEASIAYLKDIVSKAQYILKCPPCHSCQLKGYT
jgi:hypothetical protein